MIPKNDSRAVTLANKIEGFGIDLNSAANGVYLPSEGLKTTTNVVKFDSFGNRFNISNHVGRHSRDYFDALEEAFRNVNDKDSALLKLEEIRTKLINGSLTL